MSRRENVLLEKRSELFKLRDKVKKHGTDYRSLTANIAMNTKELQKERMHERRRRSEIAQQEIYRSYGEQQISKPEESSKNKEEVF